MILILYLEWWEGFNRLSVGPEEKKRGKYIIRDQASCNGLRNLAFNLAVTNFLPLGSCPEDKEE